MLRKELLKKIYSERGEPFPFSGSEFHLFLFLIMPIYHNTGYNKILFIFALEISHLGFRLRLKL